MIIQSQVHINGRSDFFFNVGSPFTQVTICLFPFTYIKILHFTKHKPSKMVFDKGIHKLKLFWPTSSMV